MEKFGLNLRRGLGRKADRKAEGGLAADAPAFEKKERLATEPDRAVVGFRGEAAADLDERTAKRREGGETGVLQKRKKKGRIGNSPPWCDPSPIIWGRGGRRDNEEGKKRKKGLLSSRRETRRRRVSSVEEDP